MTIALEMIAKLNDFAVSVLMFSMICLSSTEWPLNILLVFVFVQF
jgi:hypothetical protein